MFDEQPTKPVEDMFDGLTSPTPQARPSSGAPIVSPPSARPIAEPVLETYVAPRSRHLLKAVLILVVVIVLVGGAAYAAWRIMSQTSNPGSVVQSVPSDSVVSEPAAATPPPNQTTNPPANQASFLDTDGDGLTNADELAAGTLSNKPDTDGDGLGDREEVKVYGTNPLKPDTDGDSYADGAEVSGGYNPNGPGKLFTVPTN